MSDSKFRGKLNPFELISWYAFVFMLQTFFGLHRPENDVDPPANGTTKNGVTLHSHLDFFSI